MCRTFAVEADGIGSLYINRPSSAIREDDHVRAVTKGTAIDSNGKAPGITHPSATRQEVVIQQSIRQRWSRLLSDSVHWLLYD